MMKQRRRVVIFGNGTLFVSYLNQLQPDDYIIGVDRAAHWLLIHGVIPDVAIGDFDSVTQQELAHIQQKIKVVQMHPSRKNETDMELAVLHAIKKQPPAVVIFGGIGTRLDHTMATLHLLELLLQARIPTELRDEHNVCFLVESRTEIKKSNQHKYISLISLTETATVSLASFQYEVQHATIGRQQTIGVSNEIVGERGIIHVHEGIVCVVQSRD